MFRGCCSSGIQWLFHIKPPPLPSYLITALHYKTLILEVIELRCLQSISRQWDAINHMVLSHADNDHATGLIGILNHFEVGAI